MRKEDALRKGAAEKVPKNAPAALAWLYRMFVILRGMFGPLPEAEGFIPEGPDADQPYTVIAWVSTHAEAREQIAKLWPFRYGTYVHRDGVNLKISPGMLESIRLYISRLHDSDCPRVLGSVENKDPAEVDFLIADMATKHPRARLTLVGPGVVLRLNRKARRAALSRAKRALRRDVRRTARLAGRRHT